MTLSPEARAPSAFGPRAPSGGSSCTPATRRRTSVLSETLGIDRSRHENLLQNTHKYKERREREESPPAHAFVCVLARALHHPQETRGKPIPGTSVGRCGMGLSPRIVFDVSGNRTVLINHGTAHLSENTASQHPLSVGTVCHRAIDLSNK